MAEEKRFKIWQGRLIDKEVWKTKNLIAVIPDIGTVFFRCEKVKIVKEKLKGYEPYTEIINDKGSYYAVYESSLPESLYNFLGDLQDSE